MNNPERLIKYLQQQISLPVTSFRTEGAGARHVDLLKHDSVPQNTVCMCVCVHCLSHLKTCRSRNNKYSNKYWWQWADRAPCGETHTHTFASALVFQSSVYTREDKYHQIFRTTKIFVHPTGAVGFREVGSHVNLPASSLHMKNLQPPDQRDTKANTPAIIQLFLQIYLYWQAFIPSIHSYNQIEETRASWGQFTLAQGGKTGVFLSSKQAACLSFSLTRTGSDSDTCGYIAELIQVRTF